MKYLILIAIILVAGCTSQVVGDKQLMSEVVRLQGLSRENGTTVEMLEALKMKVSSDGFAGDLAEESVWLVRFGEWEHSEHSLAFLNAYLKDGTRIICPGHEVEHIGLFVKHDNFERLNGTIQGIEESYPKWKEDAYARRVRFPAFYRNLDEVVKTIDEVLPKIKAGNYSITEEAEFLSANDVC